MASEQGTPRMETTCVRCKAGFPRKRHQNGQSQPIRWWHFDGIGITVICADQDEPSAPTGTREATCPKCHGPRLSEFNAAPSALMSAMADDDAEGYARQRFCEDCRAWVEPEAAPSPETQSCPTCERLRQDLMAIFKRIENGELIEAATEPGEVRTLPEPDGYAHRYYDCIRFNHGQSVNGCDPIESVPYWFREKVEAAQSLTARVRVPKNSACTEWQEVSPEEAELTARQQEELDAIAKLFYITHDDETGYELPAEPEPLYFETLSEAVAKAVSWWHESEIKLEAAEGTVETLRGAATALCDKLEVALPKIDSIIGLNTLRAGMQTYDGPQLGEELKALRGCAAGRDSN